MEDMKLRKYANIEHTPQSYNPNRTGKALYEIDWDDGQLKFKNPCANVRVYEKGHIIITTDTGRDPATRERFKQEFDIDFRLQGDVRGAFFTPEGVQIPRNSIQFSRPVLYSHGRVYAGRKITFPNGEDPPYSANTIDVHIRDKENEMRFMHNWGHVIKLGVTMLALSKGDYRKTYYYLNTATNFVNKPRILNPAVPSDLDILHLLGYMQNNLKHFEEILRKACATKITVPYLINKE
jgi:hypothetical protein